VRAFVPWPVTRLRRWNWKDVRRHLTGPQGRWRSTTAEFAAKAAADAA
jgi:hypothetical protein